MGIQYKINKYSAKSNKYSTKSNKYSAISNKYNIKIKNKTGYNRIKQDIPFQIIPDCSIPCFSNVPRKVSIQNQPPPKFDYPHFFLVCLIYRWGKGPKLKNICINVTFSRTICGK